MGFTSSGLHEMGFTSSCLGPMSGSVSPLVLRSFLVLFLLDFSAKIFPHSWPFARILNGKKCCQRIQFESVTLPDVLQQFLLYCYFPHFDLFITRILCYH